MPLFVISGCSGGGKTALIGELARRGLATVPEPGMRIVAEERAGTGDALPWNDPVAFALRAVELARSDLAAINVNPPPGPVFFDRSLVDAANALERALGEPAPSAWIGQERYARTVFMTAPWPEVFSRTADRQHDFDAAEAEYESLLEAYRRLHFTIEHIPQTHVPGRADWLLANVCKTTGAGPL